MDVNCWFPVFNGHSPRKHFNLPRLAFDGFCTSALKWKSLRKLVDKLGKGRVIWRFDPLILTDRIGLDDLLRKVENNGNQLYGFTEKLVFSYADIATYKKVKANLEKSHVNYQEWTEPQMEEFAQRLSELNRKWHYQLATCGEKIDIGQYGIQHNRCVDDDLMIRFAHHDKALMDFLGVEIGTVESSLFGTEPIPANALMLGETQYAIKKKDNRDKGQRQFCGCILNCAEWLRQYFLRMWNSPWP